MRDINAILNLFANENKMNYCSDFDVIKSILEYCNEHIKQLEKIQFRGGNDKIIKEIATRIQRHFKDKLYVEENLQPVLEHEFDLRKITFFLVLNTEVNYKYDLNDDTNVCHCLGIVPQLSKCLLVNLIWELKLDKFFYEILHYTPSWFAYQFCEQSVQSLKYIKEPYEVLEKVEHLLKSIYGNLKRSDLRVTDTINQKIILNKFYDFTMELLRQFYTPDAEKFKEFKKKEFFKYSGFAIQHILDIILYCFDGYEIKVAPCIDEKYDIYNLCKEVCPLVEKKNEQSSELVRENQLKIIASLLNSLQYNVMLVRIDVFVYWVEIDLTNDLTLQASVGERAYNVLDRMSKNSNFQHDVDQQLKCIVIRPKTIQEIVKEATIGEILTKLDDITLDYKMKREWFDELLARQIAFGNDECLDTISVNIKLVTINNIFQIIDHVKLEMINLNIENTLMEIDDSTDEKLLKILIDSLQNFNTEQLIEVGLYAIKVFGKDYKNLQLPNLDERSTEFFNKFIVDFDLQQLLRFSFENPNLIWTKFFNESCSNEHFVKNFCISLKTTFKLSNIYFEQLFSTSFSKQQCNEKYFPQLIAEVYFQIYQNDRKLEFFRNFINNNATELLDSEQLDILLVILKALLIISNKTNHDNGMAGLNFGEVTAPVLLMAAQIMDKCRWDLISYTNLKDDIVRNCIEFIQNVNKKFLPVATEKDKLWINKVIKKNYKPFTQYYFQKYTLPIDVSPKKFDKFLHPDKFDTDPEIEKFLISTFVRCTTKETEWLAKSDRLLPHISDVILMLNGVVKEIGDNNVIKLYRHCMVNYARIVKKILLPQLPSESHSQVRDLGFKILNIIDTAPIQIYDEIYLSYHTILLDVFRIVNIPIEDELVSDVRKFVNTMKNCKGKEIFHEKFQAMAVENLL